MIILQVWVAVVLQPHTLPCLNLTQGLSLQGMDLPSDVVHWNDRGREIWKRKDWENEKRETSRDQRLEGPLHTASHLYLPVWVSSMHTKPNLIWHNVLHAAPSHLFAALLWLNIVHKYTHTPPSNSLGCVDVRGEPRHVSSRLRLALVCFYRTLNALLVC